MTAPILSIRRLSAVSELGNAEPILRNVSLDLAAGETLGLVGESGAGKSTIAKALLGVLPRTVRITQGEILFEGRDLRTMPRRETRAIFGDAIALVPQDPMTALNPGRRIEAQLTDGLRLRRGMSAREAHKRALELLAEVHIRDPERVLRAYPHQLSGGMRQRVLIAAAFALEPKIIVADEPTTALDVTVQKADSAAHSPDAGGARTAVIFVTHDLGVVAQICDRVTLMFAGAIIESGPTADILSAPRHAYTRALIAAGPRYDRPDAGLKPVPEALVAATAARSRRRGPLGRRMVQDLFVATGVEVAYGGKRRLNGERVGGVKVLHGVDLRIGRGETVGIVGKSGSGKTTLGRALMRLIDIDAGGIVFDGQDISQLPESQMRPLRRRMQMIFQDPMTSLNPRHTVRRILVEPLLFHRVARDRADAERRVRGFFDRVGLPLACLDRTPHELSGGQRQRVGIARAALLEPDFVLADEIVSGLDVSTQAQALNLLKTLTRDLGLAMAFISHDLSVIRAVCDRVYVMKAGQMVEEGRCKDVFAAPKSRYTRLLIDAIPLPEIDPGWLDRDVAPETD